MVPGRLQVASESLIEYLREILHQQFGSRRIVRFFLPVMVALFLYIFIANQFSIIPLFQSIVVSEEPLVFLFRTPTSDLGMPFVLALLLILFSQVIAFSISPLRHIGNYFKIVPLFKARSVSAFFIALVEFFLGLLDIIGEISKVISLSVRLFGNIFAGELMILIISGLAAFTPYFIPIPFFVISIFSGVVQTFVFVLLSIGFMSTTVNAART